METLIVPWVIAFVLWVIALALLVFHAIARFLSWLYTIARSELTAAPPPIFSGPYTQDVGGSCGGDGGTTNVSTVPNPYERYLASWSIMTISFVVSLIVLLLLLYLVHDPNDLVNPHGGPLL
jgi:hypothetical protein